MKKKLPDRWFDYGPKGIPVHGTRFLPFKVPLKPELCRSQPKQEWFTPAILLKNTPKIKAVIDLTNTDRYYNSQDFISRGILYKKICVVGRQIPSVQVRQQFFDAVDQLHGLLENDADALIGVHCTHGLNRTGYLICKYMVLRMKIDPQEAINKFQQARGYSIERQNYVDDILSRATKPAVEVLNWRTEPRFQTSERKHYQNQRQQFYPQQRFSRPRSRHGRENQHNSNQNFYQNDGYSSCRSGSRSFHRRKNWQEDNSGNQGQFYNDFKRPRSRFGSQQNSRKKFVQS